MIKATVNILLIFLFINSALKAQNIGPRVDHLTNAISLTSGYGHHAVKDEFISQQKYSGNLVSFSIDWYKFHSSYQFHLWFYFVNSATIENYNVSANMTTSNLALAYLYPIGTMMIFDKPLYISAGPVTELSLYYRIQNIARGGTAIFDAYSAATLISLSASLNVTYPVLQRMWLEAFMQSSLISLGGKYIDPIEKNNSPVKILTLIKAQDLKFDASIRYHVSKRFSLKGGYRFNLFRITAWDHLIVVSDNAYVSILVAI